MQGITIAEQPQNRHEIPREEDREKLFRVRTNRRGAPVDLCVHYEISRVHGCDTYRMITIDEIG